MPARLSAFVIWALFAATAVYWGLHLAVHAGAVPAHAVALGDTSAGRADLTRLLGAPPVDAVAAAAAPEAAARFHLLGIMAQKRTHAAGPSHGGLALIAVDGKPARAYAVGAHLDSELVLQSVSMRTASIGPAQGEHVVVLEVPPLAAPATGTLPPFRPSGPAAPVAHPAPAMPAAPMQVPAAAPGVPQPPVIAPAAAVPLQQQAGALTR
ncbi:MAG: type II secretion system protein N [Caldimonas sp.]